MIEYLASKNHQYYYNSIPVESLVTFFVFLVENAVENGEDDADLKEPG